MADIRQLLGLNAPQEVKMSGSFLMEVPPQMNEEQWQQHFNPQAKKESTATEK